MSSALFRRDLSCRDFDELSELTEGWALDFSQLDPGLGDYRITQIGSERALFSGAYFGSALRQAGDPPPGMITFAIPAKGTTPFVWRRYQIHPSSIMVFTETTELFSISQPGFQVFTYSYLAEDLSATADQLGLPLPKQLFKEAIAYDCDPKNIKLVLDTSKTISSLYSPSPGNSDDYSLQYILHFVAPRAILMALATASESNDPASARKRKLLLQTADQYIRQNLDSPLTIGELCRLTDVSERTLQYAFLDGFGISPKQFIKRIRLCEAYKTLRRSTKNETLISEVAERLKLSHSGQFAADYQNFFGELPSETLRR